MIYLQGTGGITWPFNFDGVKDLPEYARHQLKTGELVRVEAPNGGANSPADEPMDRPADSASKATWARYIRSFEGTDLTDDEVRDYTKPELIKWADELEAEEAKRESQGS
jgi:hypothetical protein